MALGVPGPAGATGSQGPAGTNGSNGVGVSAGGTTGQALVKSSNADYATTWATISGGGGTWGSITGTLSSQTDLYNALNDKLSLSGGTMSGEITFSIDVNGNDSLVGPWGFGVENLDAGQSASIEPNQIGITTDSYGVEITSSAVTRTNPDGETFSLSKDGVSGNQSTDLPWVLNADGVSGGYPADGSFALNPFGVYFGENNEISFTRSGITFGDTTFQNTAWLGYNGTTSQYIRGDGSLYTFPPVGDRYLTSSTSTLTCDSGNGKTMTVGTGLSYSRQQDITVSYSNTIHMHGTVLTYDSATGVMTFDANTHSGSGTFSNWEVNVGGVAGAILPVGGTAGQVLAKINSTNFNTEWISLGTMATATASDYLAKADNLSGLASTSTARTNLGLGTAATQSTATFLQTANNLSDVTASTARTNLGLGAVSTDAYATNLQAIQNTSATTVLSPANSRFASISTNIWSPGVTGLSSAVSGTGANAGSTVTSLNGALLAPNTTTAGYATRGFNLYFPSNSINNGYNFGTASGHSVKVYSSAWASTVTGVKMRAVFGRMSASLPVPATLAARGYGWEWDYSTKVISIIAHNGSSLTTTAQTWTPVSSRTYDIAVYSNGAGTISLYIDGTLIGTGTGGPTDTNSSSQLWWQMEIQNEATAGSQQTIFYQNPKVITTNG